MTAPATPRAAGVVRAASADTALIATYDHRVFSAPGLAAGKRGRTVSVCIPARDEEPTVGAIVAEIRRSLVERVALVDEILVVDDGSRDATAGAAADAGARVIAAEAPPAGRGSRGPGKGQAMSLGVSASVGDLIVFLDADVRNFGAHFVVGLLGPLLLRDDTAFVKGLYRRPLAGAPDEGGRVTELVARPLLARLFPDLAGVAQPLAGETAARRELLEQLSFVDGYGVEIGLLIDAARSVGATGIAQVDLGERVHRNRRLAELTPQAAAIIDAVLARTFDGASA